MTANQRPDREDRVFWRDYLKATAAGLDPALDRRRLELKGKQELTEAVALHVVHTPA